MNDLAQLANCRGFQWDEGNAVKIWRKHQVTPTECEQAFFNRPFVVADDERHSETEKRFFALGRTDAGRRLFLVFTIRDELIRVISGRDMSRKERRIYADASQEKEEDS